VAIHPPGRVFTWEEFKKKFREANVPKSIMELKRREFENLTPNEKSIMKYVREFSLLSRYASEDVNTDEKRKKRFMRGLHPGVRLQLRMLKATDFQELVNAAITMEDDYRQVQEDRKKKARIEIRGYPDAKSTPNIRFNPKYKSRGNATPRGTTSGNNNIICRGYGARGHIERNCHQPRIICFGCKKGRHMIKDCPEKGRTGV
jgi:hypothetical protein